MTITASAPPAVTTTTLLDFSDVAMQFKNGTVALSGVDLTVNRGEFVTVVGPSGCGKSTLLRIASGLETASQGKAVVNTQRIGYVFQDASLLPWRDVESNVALLAELNKSPKADREQKAAAAIALVGLQGFEHHLPKQLSGGMKMRTSLARSLTLDPELFLFDEPFGALDEITRERLNDELLRLFTEQQFAGLFITHSVSEAVYISTKVVVMSGRPGKIVDAFDVPFEMPRDPEIRYSAAFAELVGKVSHALREGTLMSVTTKEPVVAEIPAPVPADGGSGRLVRLAGPPLAVLGVLLCLWYGVSLILSARKLGYLLPAPHQIFTDGFFKKGVAGDIGTALLRTTGVALAGLAVAIVIGVLWAIGMSLARWVERSLYSYAVILQCTPILALVPLIGFWFGYEYFARMIVCVMIALFPMVSNTLFGLKSVERSHLELFKLQKASRWTVLTKLTFPACLPSMFVGMRTSAGLAVVGAIVGDFFFRRGDPGIGSLISTYQSRLQSPELFAAILSACLLGVVIFAIFGWLSKLAVGRWYEAAN